MLHNKAEKSKKKRSPKKQKGAERIKGEKPGPSKGGGLPGKEKQQTDGGTMN